MPHHTPNTAINQIIACATDLQKKKEEEEEDIVKVVKQQKKKERERKYTKR